MRRLIVVLGLVAPAALLGDPPGAALPKDAGAVQTHLNALEESLEKAKTLRVRFDGRLVLGPNETGSFKGELILGTGKRVRIDQVADIAGSKETFQLICDGQRQRRVPGGDGIEQVDRDWPRLVRLALARSGVFLLTMSSRRRDEDKTFKIIGPQSMETSRDLDFAVCRYRLPGLGGGANLDVKLITSGLPLSREIRLMEGGNTSSLHEFYNIEVNPKLDDALFQLKKTD